jgi:hypothetical protein
MIMPSHRIAYPFGHQARPETGIDCLQDLRTSIDLGYLRSVEVVEGELDPSAAESASPRFDRIPGIDRDRPGVDFDPGERDAAVCGDILERLIDPEAFRSELSRERGTSAIGHSTAWAGYTRPEPTTWARLARKTIRTLLPFASGERIESGS